MSLWVALLLATWGAIVSIVGGRLARRDFIASGERAIYATLALLAVAFVAHCYTLFTHDFSIDYVAGNTSRNLPRIFLATAIWTGREGALLVLALMLAACSAMVVWRARRRDRSFIPFVTGVLAAELAVLLIASLVFENPFTRLDWVPPDGQGMYPGFQSLRAAVYLPVLYAGYALAAIPVAFAVAALLRSEGDAGWLVPARLWTLIGWCFITGGALLGMWQAYADADRVEHWALSVVGNGTLPIWIVMTVFLHFMLPKESGRYRLLFVPLSLAALLIALVVGESLGGRTGISLKAGEAATAIDPFGTSWTFASLGLSRYSVLNRQVTAVALEVAAVGGSAGLATSERRRYFDSRGAPTFEPWTEPGIMAFWAQDVYVVLDGLREDGSASIRVSFNPLMRLFWIIGIVMLIGGLAAMWPRAALDLRGET